MHARTHGPGPEPVLITDDRALAGACEALRRAGSFAFDTEFVGEDQYRPEVCLMQAATKEACYLVDPLAGLDVTPLWDLVADPAVEVILHAASEDLSLCFQQTGRRAANVFDCQIGAGLVGLGYPMSLSRLARAAIGASLHKSETLTNWRARPLGEDQLHYAAADVMYLPAIAAFLQDRLRRADRLSWAKVECEALCEDCATLPSRLERVRRLRGAGALDSRALATAHAILEERDELARLYNRPARTVIRDHLVIELAKRGWTDPKRMQTLRGLNLSRDALRRVSIAIEAAAKQSAADWPTIENDPETPEEEVLLALLNAVLRDFCNRESIAFSILATKSDLRAYVRGYTRPGEKSGRVCFRSGWRRQAVGELLDDIMGGRTALRVVRSADGRGLTLASTNGSPAGEPRS